MRFAISASVIFVLATPSNHANADDLRTSVLRQQAIESGLVPVDQLLPVIDESKSKAGKLLFESKELSLNREIACQNCHLDRFASADGIPLGIGPRAGDLEGIERMRHGGDMLPRNTLPFWGRGGIGFDIFFWDGRVDARNGLKLTSQFGDERPSDDPLVVAAHLPVVQIKEMVKDDDEAEYLRTESLDSANEVYRTIATRVTADPKLARETANAFGVQADKITYLMIAQSLATFIRDRFRLRSTKFHKFVFSNTELDPKEIEGGLIFYGRGKCVSCHNGPYFTDFSFHALPFEQFGRGMNGFGIDYGRYNVTADPNDMYKFRTPPLYNVEKTGPYSHSGAEYDLKSAIRTHVDPLAGRDFTKMSEADRTEYYGKLNRWLGERLVGVELSEDDLDKLVAFLRTLSFEDVGMN